MRSTPSTSSAPLTSLVSEWSFWLNVWMPWPELRSPKGSGWTHKRPPRKKSKLKRSNRKATVSRSRRPARRTDRTSVPERRRKKSHPNDHTRNDSDRKGHTSPGSLAARNRIACERLGAGHEQSRRPPARKETLNGRMDILLHGRRNQVHCLWLQSAKPDGCGAAAPHQEGETVEM